MNFNKLTAEQRLTKAVVAIMNAPRYRHLSALMLVGSRTVVRNHTRIRTACTNGKDEIYSGEFVDRLRDSELRFLVLHEVYHKLYRHLTTWRWMYDQNPRLANKACDFVINVKLVDDNKDGFATMTGALTVGCFDEKYRGWDSAKVFRDLKTSGDGDGDGDGDGEGFDEHDWDGAQEMDESEKRALEQDIDRAIRQGALIASKTGTGGTDRSFDELLQPQVRWQDTLRDFINSTCAGSDYGTWSKPNRRYIGAGHYLPSGVKEQVDELVIAPDMSGSTFAPGVLPAFMSEMKGLLEMVKPRKVHVLYWDTSICRAEVYEGHEIDTAMTATRPKGGGGTTVECVPTYMAEHGIKPQAVVVLTDGYLGGGWGNWSCPVMWCVIDNPGCRPSVGTVAHIKTEEFV